MSLIISSYSLTFAQFYNGHQMTFGKNRVQYNGFYWQYYRFDKFDTYCYVGGSQLAEYVSEVANEELKSIEYELDIFLQLRMIFIVYNKQSEFRQSNIGLVTGNENYNIGGVTKIVDNKVFLYYNGDHNELRQQIRASTTEIILNKMLYDGSFKNRISSSARLTLPAWFLPGLASYIAYDDDYQTEALIKNGILTGKYNKIHSLTGTDAKYTGHAFWRYLSETYGKEIISQIIYITQVNKNKDLFTNAINQPKRYALYYNYFNTEETIKPSDLKNTWFKKHNTNQRIRDSFLQVELEQNNEPDSIFKAYAKNYLKNSLIDINNYLFESEKERLLQGSSNNTQEDDKLKIPKRMVYLTNFYSNLLVTQVDFGFMNQSYQTFTGSAFYFNPGFNLLTKVGTIDLFEDYKITGGVRFSIDFESNEHLLSLENLKYRTDRQYIFHRQVFESSDKDYYSKIFTNEVMAVYKYPFTQIHAIKRTATTRVNQKDYNAIDSQSLNKENDKQFWRALKGEYILDNTKKLGLNLYDITRLKIFAVINAELRWPAIRYLLNKPLKNEFLNNFMKVGLADVGSAWEGISPYLSVNAYNYKSIKARLFDYYIRTDWAWRIDNGTVLPRVFYLSLCTDF